MWPIESCPFGRSDPSCSHTTAATIAATTIDTTTITTNKLRRRSLSVEV